MSAEKFSNKYRIPSARKPNWDYRNQAVYFVTICTHNRLPYFGNIKNGKMILSGIGQIAENHWFEIPKHFTFIELINFVVMPNHIHGLVEIRDNDNIIGDTVETLHATSLQPFPEPHQRRKNDSMANMSPKQGSLASVIRSYKSAVTRYANRNKIEFGWQARYHDHIIRNDSEFIRINNYIINNPENWRDDDLF